MRTKHWMAATFPLSSRDRVALQIVYNTKQPRDHFRWEWAFTWPQLRQQFCPGIAKTYRHDGISFHIFLKVGVANLEGARQAGDGRMLNVRAAVRTDHLRRRERRYAQPSGRNERKRVDKRGKGKRQEIRLI